MAGHLGQLGDVITRVAAFRRLVAVQPRIDRGAEPARLRVVRVHVVLALNLVAGELEHAADRVAKDGAAAVADVQRTRGVDARELDLEAFALTDVSRAVAGLDPRDQTLEPPVGESEVHIPSGRLRLHCSIGDRDRFGESNRDRLRVLAQRARELEPRGARVVAVLGNLRPAQLQVGYVAGHAQLANRFDQGRLDRLPHATGPHRGHQQAGWCAERVSSA